MADLEKPSWPDTQNEPALVKVIRNKWLQTGVAGVPFVGGPIQVFLSHVVHDLDMRKWRSYWHGVEEALRTLDESKVDTSYFTSEDFVLRIRSIYSEITTSADEVKTRYLRDYLLACALNSKPDVTWRELFWRHLKALDGAHLVVLQSFYEKQRLLSASDRFGLPQRIDNCPINIAEACLAFEKSDATLVELICADLAARGLLARWMGEPVEPIAWSITDTGILLMDFLVVTP